jgi:hypothetical protein
MQDQVFDLAKQPVFRPLVEAGKILWQLMCGATGCRLATPPFQEQFDAEYWACENGWRGIVDGTWVCPLHAKLLGETARIGGLHSFGSA